MIESRDKMNNILRFTLILFLVNFAAASILAGVYYVTKPKIEAQEMLVREAALKDVMPESVGDRIEPVEENGAIRYWEVFKGTGSKVRGYVFISKKYGYSSDIETMVGMKLDGTITGVNILNHNETPGLGAKIIEVVSDKTIFKAIKEIFSGKKDAPSDISPYFTVQFKGLRIKELDITAIDAITGATISSKAVVDSIKEREMEILNAR